MVKVNKKPVFIIGAGPAGLTAGYYLSKHNWPVTIIEADKQVGGISKTINYKGYRFDIGGHRFLTKMDQIFKLWLEIVGKKDFLKVNRLSRIYYKNKFFSYPLKPLEALGNLGLINSLKILFAYGWAKIFPEHPENNFENWMINRFGKTLFKIFFKTYTEKVMGINTKKMSADWGKQRIKGLSLLKIITSTIFPKKFNKKIKTLTKAFHYPPFGPGQMWESAYKKVLKMKGKIKLDEKVIELIWQNNKIFRLKTIKNKGLKKYNAKGSILSSMPILDLIYCLKPLPPKIILQVAKSLKYRDFVVIVLILKKKNIFPDNWIYVHDSSLKVGRIQNYKNWSKKMVKDYKTTSSLGMEYFCNKQDILWKMKNKELINLATQEIVKMGFIKQTDVIDATVTRMEKAYPIYDLNYKKNVKIIRNWLEKNIKNLTLIGRNGMHRYNNQDHSMLTGLLAAENIALKTKNDIWQVDPDASET